MSSLKHFECVIEGIVMCVLAISGYTHTCEKHVMGGLTSRISCGSDIVETAAGRSGCGAAAR